MQWAPIEIAACCGALQEANNVSLSHEHFTIIVFNFTTNEIDSCSSLHIQIEIQCLITEEDQLAADIVGK